MAVVLVLLLFMVLIINLFHFLSMDMKADALLDNIISYYGIGEDDTITSKDPDSEIQIWKKLSMIRMDLISMAITAICSVSCFRILNR